MNIRGKIIKILEPATMTDWENECDTESLADEILELFASQKAEILDEVIEKIEELTSGIQQGLEHYIEKKIIIKLLTDIRNNHG